MRCNNIPRTHKLHAVRNKPGCARGDWQEVREPIKENQCGRWYTMQWLTAARNRTLPAELTTVPLSVLRVNCRCPLPLSPRAHCGVDVWMFQAGSGPVTVSPAASPLPHPPPIVLLPCHASFTADHMTQRRSQFGFTSESINCSPLIGAG